MRTERYRCTPAIEKCNREITLSQINNLNLGIISEPVTAGVELHGIQYPEFYRCFRSSRDRLGFYAEIQIILAPCTRTTIICTFLYFKIVKEDEVRCKCTSYMFKDVGRNAMTRKIHSPWLYSSHPPGEIAFNIYSYLKLVLW